MKLFVLTAITMTAFAANSILTRMAIDGGYIDPNSFAMIRVASGALFLAMLLRANGGTLRLFHKSRLVGALSLAVYMAGFSLAYLTLDAGLGALILFGVVQITMFSYSTMTGKRPGGRQLLGATIAFFGLALALWPGPGGSTDAFGAAIMVMAGLGWAIYTISGQSEEDALAATTANFILGLPVVFIVLISFATKATIIGWMLAIVCGGLTSGMGYALWYKTLPQIPRNLAPIVQLSVPIIALLAGAIFLGEAISLPVAVATALVVCGIALAVTSRSAPADRT